MWGKGTIHAWGGPRFEMRFFFSSLGQSWVNNVLFVPRVEWGRRRGCAHLCREGPQGWRPLNEEGAGRQKVLIPNPSSAVRPAIIFTSAA